MKSETEPMAWGFVAGAYLFLGCLLIALSGGGCGSTSKVENAPRVERPSVDKLTIVHQGAAHGHCTAWKVPNGLIMTAGHCCALDRNYYFASSGVSPTLLLDDDIHDVCILIGEMPGAAIQFAHKDPDIGDYVWTAGYPVYPLVISDGFWSGRLEYEGVDYGISSVVVRGGSSGSPLLDQYGRAVGMVVAGYIDSGDNIALSSTVEWLRFDFQHALIAR